MTSQIARGIVMRMMAVTGRRSAQSGVCRSWASPRTAKSACLQRGEKLVESRVAFRHAGFHSTVCKMTVASLNGPVKSRCRDRRLSVALFERQCLERFVIRHGFKDERADDPLRANDLPVVPAERELLAVGSTMDEAIAAAHAQVAFAADHREHAGSHPTLEMLGFRKRVEDERSGRIDDPTRRETGLTGFRDDLEFF
jgi:hypothetical protein